ncbi:MAG: iron-containing alcohol dehydrogenase [Clostridia bacterium]
MNYFDLLKKVPEHLKEISEFRTTGVKPNGKLAIGFGLADKVGEEAAKFGVGKALLVTDKVITKLGLHKVSLDSLERAGFSVDVYDEVEAEPHVETAQRIQEFVRKSDYKVVIGLGGGSPMDMAKVAAIMATNPGDVLPYMTGTAITNEGLPCILLPTTSGTGSEVSPYVVTSKDGKKLFIATPYAYATVALIDPLLTATMPAKVTAATGLDALTHGVEGLIGKPNPFSEALTNKCVEYVFDYLVRACDDSEDLEARYYMSLASVFGMMAYTQGGGLYSHSMSYILTINNNVAHGLGCGISLPYTLMFNIESINGMLAKFSKIIDPDLKGSAKELALHFIDSVHQLLTKVGAPNSLKELGISRDAIPSMADELVNKYYRVKNPRKMDLVEANKCVESMWEGKPTVI